MLAGVYRLPRLASSCTVRSRVTCKGFPFACKSTKNTWSWLCTRRTCVFTRGYSARKCQAQIELYCISIFKAHSVRGSSCSSATGAGITTKDILDAADWSLEVTFNDFTVEILRERTKLLLALQFCHLIHLQIIHVDMNGAF